LPRHDQLAYSFCVTDAQPPNARRIHAIVGWRRLLLLPLGLLVRLWCRTLRIELDGRSLEVMGYAEGPVVFTLWHNRLFIAAGL